MDEKMSTLKIYKERTIKRCHDKELQGLSRKFENSLFINTDFSPLRNQENKEMSKKPHKIKKENNQQKTRLPPFTLPFSTREFDRRTLDNLRKGSSPCGDRAEDLFLGSISPIGTPIIKRSSSTENSSDTSLTDKTINDFNSKAKNNQNPKSFIEMAPPLRSRSMSMGKKVDYVINKNSERKMTKNGKNDCERVAENELDEREMNEFEDGKSFGLSKMKEFGFLISTHLVKTAAADKAGLAVGDIFIKFGDFQKKNFPGLEVLFRYVMLRPKEKIETIILRAEGERFRCLHLQLEPRPSEDVNGGGVIGAVINVWPLPKPVDSSFE